ncbi:hypothetical protein FKP32DRAFT_1690103, partial [Trametes sanguinea]
MGNALPETARTPHPRDAYSKCTPASWSIADTFGPCTPRTRGAYEDLLTQSESPLIAARSSNRHYSPKWPCKGRPRDTDERNLHAASSEGPAMDVQRTFEAQLNRTRTAILQQAAMHESDRSPRSLPAMSRKSQSERTPSVTWRQLWLDFVADTQTMDDPAPFCWPEFQAAVVKVVPIFSPNATPSECNATMSDIQAAQAYATAYWASDDRVKFDRAAAKNQHAAGRKA